MSEDNPSFIQTWLLKKIQQSDELFQADTTDRPHEHFKLVVQGSGGASWVIKHTPWIPGEGWVAYIDRLTLALQAALREYERENGYRDPDGFGAGGYGLPLTYLGIARNSIVKRYGETK